jgi:phosphate transport system substrate-binding protein
MPGANSYPIAGYSWAMLWKKQSDPVKGREMVNLFRWLVKDGQSYAVKVSYVALPENVQVEADKALATIHN